MWLLFALLSAFFAAVLAIVIKLYLKHLNPLFITMLFSLITLVVFVFADLFTKKINCSSITSLTFKDWVPLIIAGCLNSLAFTCYLAALKYGKTCSVVAVDRLGVLFVVIFSIIILKEAFSFKAIIGAIMMIIGTFLLNA